ncbi:hypothetical protein A8139_03005 [Marinomonas primoryensis]|jgi:hypothetical protein|uniref:Uncharacterized protein n=1 Tax=Marinomonas primoryensis TaxID=178399 RepID=A0A2Z4PNK4_9GAMM|nr:hypothetical protein [Marinomonas primoryensis]AWX99081.1 hypothetical protein A8139_03005 [Marinomonas primoryensis]|tara:strand:- start:3644 stop:3826 length:183 start_codon:yes stop_codon:yes gene_type:complete
MKKQDEGMTHLVNLLEDLEKISLQDISQIPLSQQHILAEKIESLQDELKVLVGKEKSSTH